jgi:phage baseplate assembly protein W
MASRADTLTQNTKQQQLYSDFLDSFAASPFDGSLAKISNDNAVRQAIKNLILTNMGERLYQPLIGGNVNKSLFEPNDILTSSIVMTGIENTIKSYEPRASNISVNVITSNDEQYLTINVIFSVINNPVPINLTLQLKRVR